MSRKKKSVAGEQLSFQIDHAPITLFFEPIVGFSLKPEEMKAMLLAVLVWTDRLFYYRLNVETVEKCALRMSAAIAQRYEEGIRDFQALSAMGLVSTTSCSQAARNLQISLHNMAIHVLALNQKAVSA